MPLNLKAYHERWKGQLTCWYPVGIEDITLYLLLHDLFNRALITCAGRGATSKRR